MGYLVRGLIFMVLLSCSDGSTKIAENTDSINEEAATSASLEIAEPALLPLDTRMACLLSQIAYCSNPQEKLDSFLPGWKIAWYPRRINSNHALVATDGHQWAVAFRGSLMEISWHAFDNWVNQDLNIVTQVAWPHSRESGARISQGSHNSFTNLLQLRDSSTNKTLTEFLQEKISASTKLLLTGHSLGGSLATVYSSYLHAVLSVNPAKEKAWQVISFAAPAPGNEKFANDFDQKFPGTIRLESEGDIVAKFPCTSRVSAFAANCSPLPAANGIEVSYQGVTVSLQKAIEMASLAMVLLEFKNGGAFKQVAGPGQIVKIEPVQLKNASTVEDWFTAAGYQHGIAQYAAALDVPVILCP